MDYSRIRVDAQTKYPLAYLQGDYIVRNIGGATDLVKWKERRALRSWLCHEDRRTRLREVATKVKYLTLSAWGTPITLRLFGFDIVVYRRASRV